MKSAAARPIYLPSASALDAVRERVEAALAAWSREWVNGGAAAANFRVLVQPCSDLDDATREEHQRDAEADESGGIGFRRSTSDRVSLARAVLGADWTADPGWADLWTHAVIDRAWAARNRALREALRAGSEKKALSPSVFAFGSGALHLCCGPLGLSAIADASVWKATSPAVPVARLGVVTPLDQVMHEGKVRVEVVLGSVEVEVPELLNVRSGDVLKLPQRLTDSMTVLCEGRPLARAALGEREGHKCIQLLERYR